MEKENLLNLLLRSKNDSNCMTTLIEKFQPILRKYAVESDYEDAYNDLLIEFIEFVKKFNDSYLINKDDFTLLAYIRESIYHSYIKKSKINTQYKKMHRLFSEISEEQRLLLETLTEQYDTYSELDDLFFKKYLTDLELNIIKLIYYHDLSVNQISKFKKMSRQAVNQTKIRAISKLKNKFD